MSCDARGCECARVRVAVTPATSEALRLDVGEGDSDVVMLLDYCMNTFLYGTHKYKYSSSSVSMSMISYCLQ